MTNENSKPTEKPDYWFAAKRRGWGWGLPANRKGWAVLVAVGVALFLPRHRIVGFVIYCGVLSLLLILVCYLTGEPPRWRWDSTRDRRRG